MFTTQNGSFTKTLYLKNVNAISLERKNQKHLLISAIISACFGVFTLLLLMVDSPPFFLLLPIIFITSGIILFAVYLAYGDKTITISSFGIEKIELGGINKSDKDVESFIYIMEHYLLGDRDNKPEEPKTDNSAYMPK